MNRGLSKSVLEYPWRNLISANYVVGWFVATLGKLKYQILWLYYKRVNGLFVGLKLVVLKAAPV